jgi:hypothetical protein
MVTSLIFSQSNYPLKTVIKGDSVVILTVKQADDINNIFESQKAKIAAFKKDIITRDSIIAILDTIILEKDRVIIEHVFDDEISQRLDLLEAWLLNAAINNVWIYYSWDDSTIYAVDLIQYNVRKDNATGDLYFYKCPTPIDPYENKENPLKGWERAIVKPERPKVTKVPIKL